MAALDLLQQLYDSEINFMLRTTGGDGIEAALVSEEDGMLWFDTFDTVDLAVEALVNAVLDAYPESKFAASYHGQGI